jgi:hypothetical protein
MKNAPCVAWLVPLLFMGRASAQIIDDYNANSLGLTSSLSTWTPTVGSDLATTGNSGQAAASVANTDPVFNGNKYVSFGSGAGLATAGSLFSGRSSRTVATVYATTSAPTVTASIAGVANPGSVGTWFDIQDRNNFVTGDPYFAGYGADLTNNVTPTAEQLTFALATYDGTTLSLYWAFGTTGTIQSLNTTLSLNTSGQFEIGYNNIEASPGQAEIGDIQIFNTSMNAIQAAADIHALQTEYSAVPEPSTYVMMFAGLGLLSFCLWRKGSISRA